jgi:alpha-galactosidase
MTRPVRWLRLLGMVAVVAGALTSAAPGPALAAGGGAAPTPIMGWSSWSNFRGGITESIVVAQARAMHSTLQSHGYTYVNIDSGWTNREDGFGRKLWNTSRFPSGIPALASRLHGMGLKLGIYLTPGISQADVAANVPVFGTSFHAKDFADTTANGNTTGSPVARIDLTRPGSHEYIQSLANLYASWGVDYIKMDFVGPGGGRVPADNRAEIQAWHQAILNTRRPIVLELSNSLSFANASTWQQFANGWRIEGDIECYRCEVKPSHFPLTSWSKASLRWADLPRWTPFAGPGGFNDLDSLEVGAGANDGLTVPQRQSVVTLWSIASAPLILGPDLTHLDRGDLALITNDEVIAVDQAAVPASPLTAGGSQQVWRSKQADGTYVVALFNLSTTAKATVGVKWSQLGFNRPAAVRDLWGHTNLGTKATGFSASLGPGATRLLRVTPS